MNLPGVLEDDVGAEDLYGSDGTFFPAKNSNIFEDQRGLWPA